MDEAVARLKRHQKRGRLATYAVIIFLVFLSIVIIGISKKVQEEQAFTLQSRAGISLLNQLPNQPPTMCQRSCNYDVDCRLIGESFMCLDGQCVNPQCTEAVNCKCGPQNAVPDSTGSSSQGFQGGGRPSTGGDSCRLVSTPQLSVLCGRRGSAKFRTATYMCEGDTNNRVAVNGCRTRNQWTSHLNKICSVSCGGNCSYRLEHVERGVPCATNGSTSRKGIYRCTGDTQSSEFQAPDGQCHGVDYYIPLAATKCQERCRGSTGPQGAIDSAQLPPSYDDPYGCSDFNEDVNACVQAQAKGLPCVWYGCANECAPMGTPVEEVCPNR